MTQVAITSRIDVALPSIIERSDEAHIPNAEKILRECIQYSQEVRFGLIDGEVACVWGLMPPTLLSNQAYLWLFTTDIVAEHKFLFVRHSQLWIEQALKAYPEIIGVCFQNNYSARRWLKWLGAEFGEVQGNRIPFTIRAKNG